MPDEKKQNENINNLKLSIEHIIGANTKLKRRKKTLEDLEKEKFLEIISEVERLYARSCLTSEVSIDTSKYDESFYKVIDLLIELHFTKTVSEVIYFYLYDRVDTEGNIHKLTDEKGEEIPLSNAIDLYILIKKLTNKTEEELKNKPLS